MQCAEPHVAACGASVKKLTIDYTTSLEFSGPVVDHHFLLRCLPQENAQQQIHSLSLEIAPEQVWYAREVDSFNNQIVVGHLSEPHAAFSWSVHAIAFVDQSRRRPMPYKPLYRYPSKFTQPGPAIDALVAEIRAGVEGNPRVQTPLETATYAMNALYERFRYVPGVTGVRTSAEEALAGGQGVCQDYAHILIACCRRLGIMARYVAGLLTGEGATHAWAEVYQAGTWWEIDPTHNRAVNDDYVRISNGRDYGDCMLDVGVFCGEVTQKQTVLAKVHEQ